MQSVKMRIRTDRKQFEVREDNVEGEDIKHQDQVSDQHEDGKMETDQEEMNEENMKGVNNNNFNEENIENEPPVKERPKRNPSDVAIPTESPAKPGCNDNAVDTTGSQKSQVSTAEQEDFGVRCPCGCNEDDGLMILCAICKYWQHGICFLIQSEDEAPAHHVCDVCAVPGEQDKHPTDTYLCNLSSIAVQATCLWRRALLAVSEMNRVLAPNLAKRLGIEITVAQGVINRLEKEGFIKNQGKGKRLGKIVDKDKIKKGGFDKYLKRSHVPVEQKKSEDEKNEVTMQEEEKEKEPNMPKEEISNKISEITTMTNDMMLSKSMKKKRLHDAVNNINEVRHSPRITAREKKEELKRGKKRAFSKVDQGCEFDIADSQDVVDESSGLTRKKASIVSKAIRV